MYLPRYRSLHLRLEKHLKRRIYTVLLPGNCMTLSCTPTRAGRHPESSANHALCMRTVRSSSQNRLISNLVSWFDWVTKNVAIEELLVLSSSFIEHQVMDLNAGFPKDKPSYTRDYDYDCDSDLESISEEDFESDSLTRDQTDESQGTPQVFIWSGPPTENNLIIHVMARQKL